MNESSPLLQDQLLVREEVGELRELHATGLLEHVAVER